MDIDVYAIDPRTPIDDLEPDEIEHAYREAAKHLVRHLWLSVDYIMRSKNKTLASWVICHAYGLPAAQGVTMDDTGEVCGVTRAAVSKAVAQYRDRNDVPPSLSCRLDETRSRNRAARNGRVAS